MCHAETTWPQARLKIGSCLTTWPSIGMIFILNFYQHLIWFFLNFFFEAKHKLGFWMDKDEVHRN